MTSVAFLHDGRVLASAGAADGAVKLGTCACSRGAGAPLASLEDRELPVERGGVPGIVTRRARGVTALARAAGAARDCARRTRTRTRRVRRRAPEPVLCARGHRAPSRPPRPRSARRTHVASGSRPRGARVARGQADGPPAALRATRGRSPRWTGALGLFDHRELRRRRHREGLDDQEGERGGGGCFPRASRWGRGKGAGEGGRAGRRGGEDEDEDEDAEMEAGEEEDAGEGEEAWWRATILSSPRPRPSSSNDPRCRTPAAARERARAPPSVARRSSVSGGGGFAPPRRGAFRRRRAAPGDDDARRTTLGGTTRAREPRARCGTRPATASGTASATGDVAPPRGRKGRRGEAEGGERRGARGRRAGGVRASDVFHAAKGERG